MKFIPVGASLVVMVGPSGSGKSTFIEKHFDPRSVVSSDALRIEMIGDLRRQDKNDVIFTELDRRVSAKLDAGQRVVIDATNLRDKDRRSAASLGLNMNVPVTYVVVNRSVLAKLASGGWRRDVRMKNGLGLIETHEQTFVANEKKILAGDGLKGVQVVDTRVDQFTVVNELPRDAKLVRPWLMDRGFTKLRVVGDVHGNMEGFTKAVDVPDDTFLLFLGDILDYDPRGVRAVEKVLDLMRNGRAANLRGNHEKKMANWVTGERGDGFRGTLSHGNDATANVVKAMTSDDRAQWERDFLTMVEMSPDWVQIDNWMFTHGAAHRTMWDDTMFRAPKDSKQESFAMYGQTSGKFVDGYPVRLYDWVNEIEPRHNVMVGHAILSPDDPVAMEGTKGGRAVFLDTGSSKNFEDDPARPGHLSWADFELRSTGMVFSRFGRE
jgi:protein phosphatase